MSLKHGLLGLLNYNPMTGYELDKLFKESLNFFWQAQATQIYRELCTMENKEWISCKVCIQDGKPNKKIYSITNIGLEELLDWIASDNLNLSTKNEFLLKLFFCGEQSIEKNIQLLNKYRQCCMLHLEKLKQIPASISSYNSHSNSPLDIVYWEATVTFGAEYFLMNINWADNFIKKLEELK